MYDEMPMDCEELWPPAAVGMSTTGRSGGVPLAPTLELLPPDAPVWLRMANSCSLAAAMGTSAFSAGVK